MFHKQLMAFRKFFVHIKTNYSFIIYMVSPIYYMLFDVRHLQLAVINYIRLKCINFLTHNFELMQIIPLNVLNVIIHVREYLRLIKHITNI